MAGGSEKPGHEIISLNKHLAASSDLGDMQLLLKTYLVEARRKLTAQMRMITDPPHGLLCSPRSQKKVTIRGRHVTLPDVMSGYLELTGLTHVDDIELVRNNLAYNLEQLLGKPIALTDAGLIEEAKTRPLYALHMHENEKVDIVGTTEGSKINVLDGFDLTLKRLDIANGAFFEGEGRAMGYLESSGRERIPAPHEPDAVFSWAEGGFVNKKLYPHTPGQKERTTPVHIVEWDHPSTPTIEELARSIREAYEEIRLPGE